MPAVHTLPSPLCFLAVLAAWLGATAPGQAGAFDSVTTWVGSGANQAALVVDWNDAKHPQALVWGYRWDGTASGADMLQAISDADVKFEVTIKDWGWGLTVEGMGYDLNGNGFAAADPGDHFKPGWVAPNWWSYWINDPALSEGNPYAGGNFISSQVGMGERTLANGDWDGWRYDDGTRAPVSPFASVPEPGTLALALGGAVVLLARRARRAGRTSKRRRNA